MVGGLSPDALRALAVLLRLEHPPGCDHFTEARRVSLLLDRVADDPTGPERDQAVRAANALFGAELAGATR